MTGVTTPIDITQYYDGTGASTYLFEDIHFKSISVKEAPGSRQSKSNQVNGESYSVNFDCDTHYDGTANCQNFVLEDYEQVC